MPRLWVGRQGGLNPSEFTGLRVRIPLGSQGWGVESLWIHVVLRCCVQESEKFNSVWLAVVQYEGVAVRVRLGLRIGVRRSRC